MPDTVTILMLSPFDLNPNKTGLFEGSFFRGEGQFDPSFIFQEDLIQYQYNFISINIQLLNNLFKVG